MRAEMPKAATVMEALYLCDYAYHAQMEPLNAVATVSPAGDAAEVWCGTQGPTVAQEAPAKALGIPRDKVKVNYMLMGGGFGRRGPRDSEFVVDAVLLAKDAGRPVKVMWTREDDVHNGRFRPLSAHYLRAGLDASGKLTAWHHRHVGDRVTPFFDPVRFERGGRKDGILMAGGDLAGYDVPHQLVEQLYQDTGVRTAPLRGIGFLANKFVTETFIDEIARKRGDRSVGVPARVCWQEPARPRKWSSGWRRWRTGAASRDGRALGLAYIDYSGTPARRHRRGLARSGERTDPGARLLVHDRLRHRGAAGQCRGPDRKQHRLRARPRLERAHHHQGRRGRAVELLRLPGAAHERGAADARRGDRHRQSAERGRTDGGAAGSAGDRQCASPRSPACGCGIRRSRPSGSSRRSADRGHSRGGLPSRPVPDEQRKRETSGRFYMLVRSIAGGVAAGSLALIASTALAQAPKIGDPPEARNMRLVGYNDLQARSAYQPIIHKQGERYIAYIGHHGGTQTVPKPVNPLTGQAEFNGTSVVDVTDPKQPKYLAHIPGLEGLGEQGGGADGARLRRQDPAERRPGQDLPAAHLRWRRPRGLGRHRSVRHPSCSPGELGLKDTHKSWWECDTGIAYLVSGLSNWRTRRMTEIYDLSDPAKPVKIRDYRPRRPAAGSDRRGADRAARHDLDRAARATASTSPTAPTRAA